jgi:hypothetical protein
MRYDDVEDHLLSLEEDFDGQSDACATHLGFYFIWLSRQSMLSPELAAHPVGVGAEGTDGRELFVRRCDSKLTDVDLNARGNAFTAHYYERHFFDDYRQCFGYDAEEPDAMYQVEYSAANYEKLASTLDARLREWELAATRPTPDALLRELEGAFRPLLDAMGFQRDQYSFDKRVGRFIAAGPWGDHCIRLEAVDRPGFVFGFRVQVTSRLTVLATAVYQDKIIDHERVTSELAATLLLGVEDLPGNELALAQRWSKDPHIIEVTDGPSASRTIAALAAGAAAWLPGILRSVETLQGYEAARDTPPLNATAWFRYPLQRVPLFSAELTGNPRLLDICRTMEQALDALPPHSHHPHDVQAMRNTLARVRARAR